MKKTLRTLSLILAVVAILGVTLTGCKKKKEILILTSSEDYKIEFLEKKMEEKFPDYDIVFEYKSSGDHAAYLKASGKNSEYHITHDLEYGYLEELENGAKYFDGDVQIDPLDAFIKNGVKKDEISIVYYYEYVQQCGMEFPAKLLKQISKLDINFQVMCVEKKQ